MRINGIYETKIPLMFKTIFHSGVNCNIDGKNVNNELSLEQINKVVKLVLKNLRNFWRIFKNIFLKIMYKFQKNFNF